MKNIKINALVPFVFGLVKMPVLKWNSRACTVLVALAMLAASAQVARADTSKDQITLSCVFQGAGALKGTLTIDLKNNTVSDSYDNNTSRTIKEITDSVVKWQEVVSDSKSDLELNRITGGLHRQMVIAGQYVDWTYSCQRVQRQF